MKFPCPHCGTTLEAAPEHVGRKADCAYCSGKFTIPLAPSEPLGDLDPGELLARGLVTMPPPAAEGWEPPDPAELQLLLPQYRIEALIGRGGMGVVYKGSQSRLGRSVAVKLLPAELADDEGFVARFEREARTLAHLDHPGIIQVHDFGQTSEGHLYFVMEYVDGTDLFQMIHGPGLKPAEALEIITQVCDALQFAHSKGVVHRDIKPANILVTKEGRVKLADFGLARPMNSGHSGQLTLTRTIMGTPEYMAPEQKRGEGDHRVDLYALGVMLYEMLCGRTPQGAWQPPSQRVQVDVRLDKVVIKAMQEEPERRYQQASEVKTDVETIRTTLKSPRAAKQQGQAAKPKTAAASGTNPTPSLMRPRSLALTSGVLAIAGIGVWAAMRPPNSESIPKPTVIPQASSPNPSATALLTGGDALKAVHEAASAWKTSPKWGAVGNRIQPGTEGRVKLDFSGLGISDLAPFRSLGNVAFDHVNLGQNPITDLSPLKGLHIRSLGLTQTLIRNLSGLEGMPLRALSVNGMDRLADISGLNTLPDIEVLDLRHQVTGIKDHTPVLACRNLRKLMIGTHPNELAPLRTRNLQNINDKSPPEYWAQWNAVRQMDDAIGKLRVALQKAENGTFRPNSDTIRYFGPGRLTVALQGAKLRTLDPLRGHPVAQLELSSSDITDISAVRDLPLERLYLGNGKVTDIRPLADCQALEMIELSPGVKDLEPLRKLPKLKYISYRWDDKNRRPAQTTEEFWKEMDARK